jgi:hypothetical protein
LSVAYLQRETTARERRGEPGTCQFGPGMSKETATGIGEGARGAWGCANSLREADEERQTAVLRLRAVRDRYHQYILRGCSSSRC